MGNEMYFETRDAFLATALDVAGHTPHLYKVQNLVVFRFVPNETLYRHIAHFNANGDVPIQDFIAKYKSLRTRMYELRG